MAGPAFPGAGGQLLRVCYVAITRARQLLALTYPYSKHGNITALLDAHHIEYQTQTAPPPPAAP
ncbi:hypothetical protein AB0L75_39565 [Streptomyces sp. NPDC052101]|uniref:hypothetical protein n=1 Tax=Streptomyces sp. NPDC052101 TaxID=3155763 RepID=UPI00344466B5